MSHSEKQGVKTGLRNIQSGAQNQPSAWGRLAPLCVRDKQTIAEVISCQMLLMWKKLRYNTALTSSKQLNEKCDATQRTAVVKISYPKIRSPTHFCLRGKSTHSSSLRFTPGVLCPAQSCTRRSAAVEPRAREARNSARLNAVASHAPPPERL